MRFQLHWQHRLRSSDTIFVDEGEASTFDECGQLQERFAATVKERLAEMPEGYCQMICDEDSAYFVEQPVTVKAGH